MGGASLGRMAMTETMETATEIRRLQPKDAALYRELRLEALLRNPEAFSSTFEAETAQTLAWFTPRFPRGKVRRGR
jgi:hypothetical protein